MSDNDTDHLANLSDGAGCAEVWEHLSEQREAAAEESTDDNDESTADSAEETDTENEPEQDAPEKDAAAEVPCP